VQEEAAAREAEQKQERQKEEAVSERCASRLDMLIDPTRRMSLVSLCWACGVSERDPSHIAAMKHCAICSGMYHKACMAHQVSSYLRASPQAPSLSAHVPRGIKRAWSEPGGAGGA
jgi:GH24 family phage-related lysozyme (muramidase)